MPEVDRNGFFEKHGAKDKIKVRELQKYTVFCRRYYAP
jgi:hypothetical protein